MKNEELKFQLEELIIDNKKQLTAKWDCGGDQAIIEYYIDGKKLHYEDDTFFKQDDLNELMIFQLQLPEVGEYSVCGNGHFFFDEKGALVVEFDANSFLPTEALVDWDAEARELFSVAKYEGEVINEETVHELPFHISLEEGRISFSVSTNGTDKFEFSGIKIEYLEPDFERLKTAFLELENQRIQSTLDSLDEEHIVSFYYRCLVYQNILRIEQLQISYTQVGFWNKAQSILIK